MPEFRVKPRNAARLVAGAVALAAVVGVVASSRSSADEGRALGAASLASALRRPLSATFGLQVDQDAPVRGRLWIDTQGQTCVQLDTPRDQRVWLGRQSMVIYNPSEQRIFRQVVDPKSLPPFLDAVVVSLRPPASSLPKGSALVRRSSGPDGIAETWRNDQGPSEVRVTLHTLHGPSGTLRTELLDGEGVLLRRYRYAERRAERGLSLPGQIEADYYSKGELRRAERWKLTWLVAGSVPTNEGACLRVSGQPRESPL